MWSRRAMNAMSLAAAALWLAAPAAAQPRTIDLQSPDGIALKASYFASERPGPGLLLLHACNRDRSSWNGLASAATADGFHVLALDLRGYGQSGGAPAKDPLQQQWIADREWPGDIDAAYAWLASQPGVDKTRMAAAGADCGVSPALQLVARHPEVRTVVLLSGALPAKNRDLMRDSPALPILAAASRGDGGVLEAMRWALGWSRNPTTRFVELQSAGHGTDMLTTDASLQPQILTWLDTHARDAAAKPVAVTASGPTIFEQFWTALHEPGGVARARRLYDDAKTRDARLVLFPEAETNLFGYELLQNGNATDALVVLQMNAEAYPLSANACDSLSDAYVAVGNKAEALKYAQKTLTMLETDPNVTADLKKLLRESSEAKIKDLQTGK